MKKSFHRRAAGFTGWKPATGEQWSLQAAAGFLHAAILAGLHSKGQQQSVNAYIIIQFSG